MLRNTHCLRIAGLALLAASLAVSGCDQADRPAPARTAADRQRAVPDQVRAIWVTRFDYKTEADVRHIVQTCADAGFNIVLFQVRGNATAFYASEFEPWAEQFDFQHPGFDPLAIACDEAKKQDVELHAWVNVMPAWRGTEPPPEDAGQLYHTHPEWFWYDQYGDRQALSTFYVSVNPCLPEVRQYLVDVFHEIVAGYDVDGLHMDYIRFPHEPPATPRGTDIEYPYDERTLALYKEQTGRTPDEDDEAWAAWRTACVTKLVRQVRQMCLDTKPDIALTAAVGANYERSLVHFRDDRTWAREKLLDAAILMNYTDSSQQFVERIDSWMADPPPIAVVPGLWFGRHRDKSTWQAASVVAEQIQLAITHTDHFCIFAYSSLFDSADDDELADQDDEDREQRRQRRAVLLPLIRALAAANR